MDLDSILSLFIQIPLVGIFVWFVLERDKRLEAGFTRRDKEWRDCLGEQRLQGNEAITRLTEEIKVIAAAVVQSSTLLSQHDKNAAMWASDILRDKPLKRKMRSRA